MRNITLIRVAVFIISLLVSYWLPFLIHFNSNHLDILNQSKNEAAFTFKNNLCSPVIANFSACSNTNLCMLALPIQSILKTTTQKSHYIYILRKLDEFQMPRELALIPIIESQYNADATSARGAAGLWQLMPKTAKNYGLLDHQRFQLEASTNVALLSLKNLYLQFGKWELAIAAYNAGSKRVQKAIIKNPLAKNIGELNLPTETKKYVNNFYQMVSYCIH